MALVLACLVAATTYGMLVPTGAGGRRGQLLPACAKAVLSTVVATVLGSMEITGRVVASVALALSVVVVTQKVARHSFADWRAATAAGLVLVTVVRFPS